MVAAHAGVSRATVSRVVNGSDTVAPEIARAVRAAVAELGYVPNRAARSLASAQTHAIALIVPEDVRRLFGDQFFADVITGLTGRLESTDYVLNLMVANQDPDAKAIRYLTGGAVDGAFVVSHHTDNTFLQPVAEAIPLVFGGRPVSPVDGAYWVDVDNRAAARMATERLISIGRTRIATVTGPANMGGGIDRLSGFREALDAAGLAPGPVVEGDFTTPGGATAMREVLAQDAGIDAVFVASDQMAVGAIATLHAAGLTVPGDVAVVGFDDSDVANLSEVPLTTVRQSAPRLGLTMAGVMLDILGGREDTPRETTLPTQLVVRESA